MTKAVCLMLNKYSLSSPLLTCLLLIGLHYSGTHQFALAEEPTIDIRQFGAKPGGKILCTDAIQKAIDACADAGAGHVVVPAGTFLTGTVFMKSNVTLRLEKGAVLLGSPWIRDYPPQAPMTKSRYDQHLRTSLVFAQGVNNVSVTGKGTLNGNSKSKNDFTEDGRGHRHRPCLIWFDECTDVRVKDITFTSAGFWTEAYTKCHNVHIDGITVKDSTFPNNDGCDILDCENVIVENCDIVCRDDAICLKGYTPEGCKNIVIRNNRVRSMCNGIKAGTDSSGGFQNILIEDNEIYQTRISGIALEVVDGGLMQNVVVRNIKMNVVGTPIFIKLGDRNRPVYVDGIETAVPAGVICDVHISGIRATVDKAKELNAETGQAHNYFTYASSITGFPGHYVERVYIEDVDIEITGGFPLRTAEDAKRNVPEESRRYPENRMFGVLPAYGFYIRHAKDIRMKNVCVAIRQEDGRPAFLLDDVHSSIFDDIQTESVSNTPSFLVEPNCTDISLEKE